MNASQHLLRKSTRFAMAAFLWTALAGVATAQVDKKEEKAKPAPYLLSYTLVILGVGLGMMVICRSSRRKDRAKSEVMAAGLTPEQLKASAAKSKAPAGPVRRGKEMSEDAKSALTLAIAAAVLPVLGLLLGPFALWKAMQAKKKIQSDARLTGEGIALAGMVVGGIAIGVGLLWVIILIVALV